MALLVRLDPHAHLYDSYSVQHWLEAAFTNLGGGSGVVIGVIVADRAGQNSFERLKREVPAFGNYREVWGGAALEISLSMGTLLVLQGSQYVTSERIEVLALGAKRSAPDGCAAADYVQIIQQEGGVPCLPWSPGKWLGARGGVVRNLLAHSSPGAVSVGDIAIRSRIGPPSLILRHARKLGFAVLAGTDPLPQVEDQRLVGTCGVEISYDEGSIISWDLLRSTLLSGSAMKVWGQRNAPWHALRRFLSAMR